MRTAVLMHALISPPFCAHASLLTCREVVELIRKLALTSILALIAPGSAGQVVVGILISFTTLVASLIISPYAQKRLNLIGQAAQMNLFFLLFVALLLKVRRCCRPCLWWN